MKLFIGICAGVFFLFSSTGYVYGQQPASQTTPREPGTPQVQTVPQKVKPSVQKPVADPPVVKEHKRSTQEQRHELTQKLEQRRAEMREEHARNRASHDQPNQSK